MTDKDRRQHAIAELLRRHAVGSQEEVADRLARLGFRATQATVSRDLEQLGAFKVRRADGLAYALPDEALTRSGPPLETVIRDWVRSIEPAGNLVVMKTPAGSAHIVGVALDQSAVDEVVGTICGDDTLFVACRSAAGAKALAARLSANI